MNKSFKIIAVFTATLGLYSCSREEAQAILSEAKPKVENHTYFHNVFGPSQDPDYGVTVKYDVTNSGANTGPIRAITTLETSEGTFKKERQFANVAPGQTMHCQEDFPEITFTVSNMKYRITTIPPCQ